MPKFRMFSGEGKDDNPYQHLSHFRACCGNTGGDNIFLLRQFAQSLTGAAFDWYCSLKDDSMKTWEDMEEAFIEKFAIITEQVSISDLASLRPKKDELISNYLARWRNLYIKCDTEISEENAVKMILKSIDNWMSPFLEVANITTFQHLVQVINRLQSRPPQESKTSFGSTL